MTLIGEINLSVEEQQEVIDKLLEEYSGRFIKTHAIKEDAADEYIQLSQEELKNLSTQECDEAAFLIAQKSLLLQKELNKQISTVTWAKSLLELSVAGPAQSYQGSFTQKEKQAIKENDAFSKLEKIRREAQLRIDRLNSIPYHLDKLIKILTDLSQAKRKRENYG